MRIWVWSHGICGRCIGSGSGIGIRAEKEIGAIRRRLRVKCRRQKRGEVEPEAVDEEGLTKQPGV